MFNSGIPFLWYLSQCSQNSSRIQIIYANNRTDVEHKYGHYYCIYEVKTPIVEVVSLGEYLLILDHVLLSHGSLVRYVKVWVTHAPGMRRDRELAVSLEFGGEESIPDISGACATNNFTYLARGPLPAKVHGIVHCCIYVQLCLYDLWKSWDKHPYSCSFVSEVLFSSL